MGTLSLITSNGQYKKYTYTHGGASTTGVHVFTTQSGQSVAPAISTTKKPLSQLNPLSVSPSNVIAKTNGCMYEYYENKFYGFFYQGSGNPMYINGTKYTTLPTSSIMYTDPKYFPSFCIKSDGTATIRWFSSKDDAEMALQYCDYVIGACHPLVYDGKCVFNQDVYEPEVLGGKLIYNRNNPSDSNSRYNTGINQSTDKRTLLGHKENGTFVMVVTDDSMSMKDAANLMYDLDCDYAVNMDGGSPVEMRIASGYGPAGKVSEDGGLSIHTAVVAYRT